MKRKRCCRSGVNETHVKPSAAIRSGSKPTEQVMTPSRRTEFVAFVLDLVDLALGNMIEARWPSEWWDGFAKMKR